MPNDDQGQLIPVLGFKQGGAHSKTITSSAANATTVASGTKVITLVCDVAAFFNIGNSTVTVGTSDHFIPANVPYDISLGSSYTTVAGLDTTVNVVAVSTSGTSYISERE